MADAQTPPQTKTGITDDGFLTDSWYLAAPSSELEKGQQHRIMMLDEPVVVGRTPDGEAFALRDICPHRLVPNGPCNAPIMAGALAPMVSAN